MKNQHKRNTKVLCLKDARCGELKTQIRSKKPGNSGPGKEDLVGVTNAIGRTEYFPEGLGNELRGKATRKSVRSEQ